MIVLYEGSGSSQFELDSQFLPSAKWSKLRQSVSGLLRKRGDGYAADLLESLPFEVFSGTNTFGDDFQVLHVSVRMDQYLDLANRKDDFDIKTGFKKIADTIYEIGPYIRFVAVSLLEEESTPAVARPTLRTTSNVVRAALDDAEHLIHSRGALNGLDRVHTALHGYLRAVVESLAITVSEDAGITELFKITLTNHPSFNPSSPRKSDVTKILRAMSNIVDALNPLRNRASLAHPNDSLLEPAEAMLVINIVRTLLQYLDSKVN
jgi:hypothetical protein